VLECTFHGQRAGLSSTSPAHFSPLFIAVSGNVFWLILLFNILYSLCDDLFMFNFCINILTAGRTIIMTDIMVGSGSSLNVPSMV